MTDAPPRQDSPEDDDGRSPAENAQGTQSQQQGQQQWQAQQSQATRTQDPPQWSADQPAPAPWFLGRPGPVPPNLAPPEWPQQPPMPQGAQNPQQAPAPPLPPPNADQAGWPNQAPGMRPEQGQGGQQGQPSDRVPSVPPWTGQAPPNPEQPNGGGQNYPGTGAPGTNPQPSAQQPAPWLDPNRYAQPGGRPPAPSNDPRSGYRPQPPQQQPRRGEPEQRPPLSLRTRWARGLSMGGALCTLITLLNGYRNFPAWLIGASVALLMSLGSLWLGAFAQRDASRKSQRAPEAAVSVVWSGISTLIAVAIVSFSLIFYPQLRDFSNCMRDANTIAAQNTCQTQFDNSMTFKP